MANEVKGARELQAKLERLASETPNEVLRALFEEASIEMKESMRRTPVDTGALRASHELKKAQSGRDVAVTITVGGPAAPYAIPVHENLEAHHEVGQAKFLESTILESAPFMAERIGKRIDLNRMAR